MKKVNIPAFVWERDEIRHNNVWKRAKRRVKERFESLNGMNLRRVPNI